MFGIFRKITGFVSGPDRAKAEALTEEAIAILSSGPIYKRVFWDARPPKLQSAYKLLQKAAIADHNGPVGSYNFGVCLYYVNLYESAQLNFQYALEKAEKAPRDSDSQRVIRYHKAFMAYVYEHLESWLGAAILVNPGFFISRINPNENPPERPEFDANVLL